jgi:hypothetical protein
VAAASPGAGVTTLARAFFWFFSERAPVAFFRVRGGPPDDEGGDVGDPRTIEGLQAVCDRLLAKVRPGPDGYGAAVVDVSFDRAEEFFDAAVTIDFFGECRRRGIAPAAVFLDLGDERSRRLGLRLFDGGLPVGCAVSHAARTPPDPERLGFATWPFRVHPIREQDADRLTFEGLSADRGLAGYALTFRRSATDFLFASVLHAVSRI